MRTSTIVLGVSLFVAGVAARSLAESGDYAFEVPLAAVSPVGDFPIRLETPEFLVNGTIHVALDAQGRLTATADFPGRQVQFAGRFAAARGRESISLRTPGRGGARLNGTLAGNTFAGRFVDGGSLTKGAGTFSIDVSSAHALTASVQVSAHGGFGAVRHGTGSAAAEGATETLGVDVVPGARTTLRVRGPGFAWSGKGELTPGALTVQSWRATGFGATATGTGLGVAFDAVPDISLILSNGDAQEAAPGAEPADLSRDAGPFLAHRLAGRGLEFETSAFGDVDEGAPGAAYSGMVAKLESLRDSLIAGRRFPTRVVVVSFGHGAVRAHAAVRDVADVPIAAMVDLDASACGWAAQGHDTADIGGDPVGIATISGAPFDLVDIVFPNVATSLDVHSTSMCPAALSGGGDPVAYDQRVHRRLDGSVSGVFFFYTDTTHDELHDVFGTTLPKVGRWLADLLGSPRKR